MIAPERKHIVCGGKVIVTDTETKPDWQCVGVAGGVVGTALGRSVVMVAATGLGTRVFDSALTGWMGVLGLAAVPVLVHPSSGRSAPELP
jgi:hypothetical protein